MKENIVSKLNPNIHILDVECTKVIPMYEKVGDNSTNHI